MNQSEAKTAAQEFSDSLLPSSQVLTRDNYHAVVTVPGECHLRRFHFEPELPTIAPGTLCEFSDDPQKGHTPRFSLYERRDANYHIDQYGTTWDHATPYDSTNGLFKEAIVFLKGAREHLSRTGTPTKPLDDFLSKVAKHPQLCKK